MPGTGLAETIRQIAQFPTKTAVAGGDLLLLQSGGLGGPYQTVAAANLVGTALESGAYDLNVGGNIGCNANLSVDGTADVGGDLSVVGNAYIDVDCKVGGDISTAGNAYVDAGLAVGATATVAGELSVNGPVGFQSTLEVSGPTAIGSNLQVNGSITAIGALSAKGPFYMTGDGSFTGNLLLGGGAQFGGGAKFGGGVYTAGSITAEGGVGLLDCLSVGKDATIGGNTNVAGNLAVTGCSQLGPTGITGDLNLLGNLCLAGNLTATGQANLDVTDLKIRGDGCVVGNLGVCGLLDAGSGYFKDGIATASNAKIEGGLYVGGPSTFSGPVFLNNDLTVNGRVGICGTLHLNGMAVATEPWVTGYVCHVGADLLTALSDAVEELETKIVDSVAGVHSFNHRTGAVELQSTDITSADGVLRPPTDSNWYAWHDGDWTAFQPGGGGGGDGGIPEPTSAGLFGRSRNGAASWQPVPPLPPINATDYFAWHDGTWVPFTPGGGGGTGGITQQDLDNALANYLPLAGGTLSGALTLPADGTGSQAVRYSQLANYLPLAGGILTGPLVLPSDGSGNQAVRYSQIGTMLAAYATTAAMNTAIGAATTDMATQQWTSGQISSATSGLVTSGAMNSAIGTATSDMATQTWTNGAISTAISGISVPNTLQISFVIPGKPGADQRYYLPVTVDCSLPASLTGSYGYAAVGAAMAQTFQLYVYRAGSWTQIGSIGATSSNTLSFSGTGSALSPGNILQVVSPATQDANLADLGISLLATRT